MFDSANINAAKKKINEEVKAFVTSDGSVYLKKRNESLESLLKHCSDKNLTLLDVEENQEIQIKLKKIKDVSAES